MGSVCYGGYLEDPGTVPGTLLAWIRDALGLKGGPIKTGLGENEAHLPTPSPGLALGPEPSVAHLEIGD